MEALVPSQPIFPKPRRNNSTLSNTFVLCSYESDLLGGDISPLPRTVTLYGNSNEKKRLPELRNVFSPTGIYRRHREGGIRCKCFPRSPKVFRRACCRSRGQEWMGIHRSNWAFRNTATV